MTSTPAAKQNSLRRFCFLTSTVGKKYLMAISGAIWVGFVFAHMAGNMLIFVGPDAYNSYGHALTSGELIYIAETVLVLALILHVYLAISLTVQNRRAQGGLGQRYAVNPTTEKRGTFASRTMAVQGSLILAFIIIHLITFKYGKYYETTVGGVPMRDLYRLAVEVFQNPWYVGWYCIALICLFFHLGHGVGSIFQSLGLKKESTEHLIHRFGIIYGVVVIAGFMSQPIYCYFFQVIK